MQPYQDPEFAGLSTEDLARIDQVVSQYETLRRSGESIEIDGFIATQPPAIHPLLRRELVGVEAEILGDWGDATGLARLAERWPGYAEFIRSQASASTSDWNKRFVIRAELAEGGLKTHRIRHFCETYSYRS